MTEFIKCDRCGHFYEKHYTEDTTRIEVYRYGYECIDKHYCHICIQTIKDVLGLDFKKIDEVEPLTSPA